MKPYDSNRDMQSSGNERFVYLVPEELVTSASAPAIGLKDAARFFWEKKLTIIISTAAFGMAAVTYSLLASEWYRASVVIIPAEKKALPASLGQISGLASLAGLSVGAGSSQEPIAYLKSNQFAQEFIEKNQLMQVLFADSWDASANKWKIKPGERPPDIRDGVRIFNEKIRNVVEDKKSGTVTLSISWKDSASSAQWANSMVSQLNAKLRQISLADSEKNISYLKAQMLSTSILSMQQSASRLMESEMQKYMVAQGNEEFAFKVVDRSVPPKRRYWPQRTIISLSGSMLGFLLSMAYVYVGFARSRKK